MVDIVVRSIVGGDMLKGIPGESISTVVIHGLDGGASEEPHPLTGRHASGDESKTCACGVQKKALEGMII